MMGIMHRLYAPIHSGFIRGFVQPAILCWNGCRDNIVLQEHSVSVFTARPVAEEGQKHIQNQERTSSP